MSDTHVELLGSRRPLAKDARKVRDLDPHAHIDATVVLEAPKLPAPADLPEKAQDPAELEKQYAAAPADVQKVEAVLQSYGLKIDGVTPSGRNLRVSGPASAIEAAFQAGLAIYHSPTQGEFRGREGTLSVPAELKGLVRTVLGLDQRRMARRHMAQAAAAVKPAVSGAPLTPSELRNALQLPSWRLCRRICRDRRIRVAAPVRPIPAASLFP